MSGASHDPGRSGHATLPPPDLTLALTGRIAHGNKAALSALYESRFEGMFRAASAVTGRDESFCLDVVQEAFVRLIRSMPALPNEAALSAFLRRTVLSAAYDMLRREKRRGVRERAYAADRRESAPDAVALDEERLRGIEGQMADLDQELSSLLEMRHRFGWTLARIGSLVGLRPGAVDGRLSRAQRRLAREGGHE